MDITSIKLRYGIIGNSSLLDRAINIALQVAPTDLTVLITGESGTGKEVFPQIIHQNSLRKHGQYIAVNCGAIPEGTIDSELFGHEKGSFTGAHEARKGYFEVANGGTIFLDEIADLPLSTQVRLLRVLESGEYLRVGSSKVQKTDVRVVAATNVNIPAAINTGKFREDLFYRLSNVPIQMPALRERPEDIILLFRKFSSDTAEKYRMPQILPDEEAKSLLLHYRWPGNIRQLKNLAEQISIIETTRTISAETLRSYLPEPVENFPAIYNKPAESGFEFSDRELLYKVLFEMRKDINDMKKLVADILQTGDMNKTIEGNNAHLIRKLYDDVEYMENGEPGVKLHQPSGQEVHEPIEESEIVEESLSIAHKEMDLIRKALQKYNGRRKKAADELGISERTLYRKIKEYNVE